ncbi:MAG: HEPN domain-containing protein [Desulfamplus sp.]|nr:HEPN domain-containing protein [Desulfamplus sp.]
MKESTVSWVEFAKRDLQGARELLKNEYLANLVMFHSQQCIEKIFKAVLEEHSIHIPKIHNLKKIYGLFPDKVLKKIHIEQDKLDIIDQIYIDSRYPADFGLLPSGIPTQKEAEQIYNIAENISGQILKLMEG